MRIVRLFMYALVVMSVAAVATAGQAAAAWVNHGGAWHAVFHQESTAAAH